jgi:phage shock protein PspC (stress-responsive transcriptional regulator)
MQKVVGINLNGNAYQLEEPGYEALRAYLERADGRLQSNPDRAEIMGDLEQAIAEKCARYLGASKSVVTAAEIDTIIGEMGPVESPEANADTTATGGAEASMNTGANTSTETPGERKDPRRRLYQIRQGAMISGVCNGLAAFLDVDVTVVRLLFVIITFATFGAWIIAYLLMAMFIPYADTPEDRAAAYGFRLKAEELLGHNLHRAREHAFRQWRRSFGHGLRSPPSSGFWPPCCSSGWLMSTFRRCTTCSISCRLYGRSGGIPRSSFERRKTTAHRQIAISRPNDQCATKFNHQGWRFPCTAKSDQGL